MTAGEGGHDKQRIRHGRRQPAPPRHDRTLRFWISLPGLEASVQSDGKQSTNLVVN